MNLTVLAPILDLDLDFSTGLARDFGKKRLIRDFGGFGHTQAYLVVLITLTNVGHAHIYLVRQLTKNKRRIAISRILF